MTRMRLLSDLPLRCNKNHCVKLHIILLVLMAAICAMAIGGCYDKNEIGAKGDFIPKTERTDYDDSIKPFSFVVMSDLHASEPVRKGYEKFGTARDKFKLCLDKIKEMEEAYDPEFVLITGDIHLWAIKDLISDFELPIHVVVGNHEKKEHKKELREFFPNDFKKNGKESDYYSFVHNNVRFIGICDAVHPDHVGHLSAESILPFGQSEWLESELEKKEKTKIIFGHIPPEPNGKDKNMWLSRNDSLFFNDLIERTKPAMMFFGHQHEPKKLTVSGCDLYVVRSTSWNFNEMPIGFLLVSFQKEGVVVKEIILE